MLEVPEKKLLSVKEVSVELGIGVTTVWCQVKKGNLPAPIKVGGSTRWRREEIEAVYTQPKQ